MRYAVAPEGRRNVARGVSPWNEEGRMRAPEGRQRHLGRCPSSVALPGLNPNFASKPRAHALGYDLPPLRGGVRKLVSMVGRTYSESQSCFPERSSEASPPWHFLAFLANNQRSRHCCCGRSYGGVIPMKWNIRPVPAPSRRYEKNRSGSHF